MKNKTSLRNAEIIISYRESSQDRKDNIYTNLRYLNHTFTDYRLLLLEADVRPVFDWQVLSDEKIEHHFFFDEGSFPKAFLYNKGVKFCSSKVIILLDADCILNPNSIQTCVDDLLDAGVKGGGRGVYLTNGLMYMVH